ncbi:DUF397 domain-containing protein, partial [Micromonospora tarensis]
MDLIGAVWRTSTRSGSGGGNCVEVADNLPGVVGVPRLQGPDRAGPALAPASWRAFAR